MFTKDTWMAEGDIEIDDYLPCVKRILIANVPEYFATARLVNSKGV